METGSSLPSLADNTLLILLILFAAADLLTAVILYVYRYLLDEDIVIPGGDVKRNDRPISERLLDDEDMIDKLRTAARFFTIVTGGLGVVYFIRITYVEQFLIVPEQGFEFKFYYI